MATDLELQIRVPAKTRWNTGKTGDCSMNRNQEVALLQVLTKRVTLPVQGVALAAPTLFDGNRVPFVAAPRDEGGDNAEHNVRGNHVPFTDGDAHGSCAVHGQQESRRGKGGQHASPIQLFEGEDVDRVGDAPQADWSQGPHGNIVKLAEKRPRRQHRGLQFLTEGFQAAGGVDGRTDDRKIQPPAGTDIAEHDVADV
jgi:hypothetical protein